jgi:hypothetical protein
MLVYAIKMLLLVPVIYFIMGCASTGNPTNPELDSPIVFGEVAPAPWGCMQWQKTTEIKGVWSVESKCCPLEKEEGSEDWKMKGWDC